MATVINARLARESKWQPNSWSYKRLAAVSGVDLPVDGRQALLLQQLISPGELPAPKEAAAGREPRGVGALEHVVLVGTDHTLLVLQRAGWVWVPLHVSLGCLLEEAYRGRGGNEGHQEGASSLLSKAPTNTKRIW